MLETLQLLNWQDSFTQNEKETAINALEAGKVVFLPSLGFTLLPEEKIFLSDKYSHPKNKNIGYSLSQDIIKGVICSPEEKLLLKQMMVRYAKTTRLFLEELFPSYSQYLQQARTSFRPVEIAFRKPASYRKDDTRLHVDAFPSTPTQGNRILRVFTNMHPEGKTRVWRLGESFPDVVSYFQRKLHKPLFGSTALLHSLKITRQKRSLYDHYMLQLHNSMKKDLVYQQQAKQCEFHFPANSSWIVYTDQVSHAALSGQYAFEQTFYLPLNALRQPDASPYRVLENMKILLP